MKGIYVLIISVDRDIQVNVGALGIFKFEKGLYAYVGSAQNYLEKRVKRHLGKNKKKFWHIDYLLDGSWTKVLRVYHKNAGRPEECKIAEELNKKGVPIPGFGSSDCKCESHLFKIQDYDFLSKDMSEMGV
jgi:Uri superfamily endonuclease